jgi:hypothetical protein
MLVEVDLCFLTTMPQSCSGGCSALSMTFELDGPAWLDEVAFSALKEGEHPPVTKFREKNPR